jgi:outer membrane protein assembly factor BamB
MYACHPDIATDRHVIFNRPADFMAWADGKVSRFRASRPACRHGATLGNGLFYSAPNICLCVQGVIHGYVGLAPAPAASDQPKAEVPAGERLETGPAFGKAGDGAAPAAGDWPTFRFDPSRSAAAGAEKFSPKLKVLWTAPVAGARPAGPSLLADEAAANWTGGEPLTAPTVAGGRVFVALPDRHALAALDAATGRPAWSATLGGRTDVPPTIHGGLCLTAARDGWVYALGAADGKLAWRYRAAPEERRIVAFGQVESPWPAVGGVLVRDGLAYACFGRSSESDGGAGVCCLEPAAGKLLWETRPPNDAKGFVGLADLLVADGKAVSCGGSTHFRLDPKTGKLLGREILDAVRAGTTNGQYHGYIGSAATLLDRSWHSSGVTKVEGRFQTQWKDGLTGQLVIFDKTRAVASQLRMADKQIAGVIVAQNRAAKVTDKTEPLWKFDLPAGQRAVALAIAGEHLMAGVASADRKQGRLLVLSMKDGAKLAEHDLPAAPAAEGLAVAGGSVYVSTWTGEVLCLAPEP